MIILVGEDHGLLEKEHGSFLISGFTSCSDETISNIKSSISQLPEFGIGTNTPDAIGASREYWTEAISSGDSTGELKYNILVTDGEPAWYNESREVTKNNAKNEVKKFKYDLPDVNFLTLLVGNETKEIKNIFEDGDAVIHTNDGEAFASAIIDGTYDFISSNYVDTSNITTIEEKNNFFETADTYVGILDNELSYGSTVIADYSIHVKYTENLENIYIIDYLPKEMQFVSSNYDCDYDSETHTLNFSISPSDGDDETIVKIRLSILMSSSNDINNLENTADIKIKTADGREFPPNSDSEDDAKDYRLHSIKLSILPPFGNKNIFQKNIFLILLINCIIILLYLIYRKLKPKNSNIS